MVFEELVLPIHLLRGQTSTVRRAGVKQFLLTLIFIWGRYVSLKGGSAHEHVPVCWKHQGGCWVIAWCFSNGGVCPWVPAARIYILVYWLLFLMCFPSNE